MRTRTRLTTPPGQQPTFELDESEATERYMSGPEVPDEPRIPGRFRRLWLTLAVVVGVAALGVGIFFVSTSGQQFDPALDFRPGTGDDSSPTDQSPAPTDEVTLPGEDG